MCCCCFRARKGPKVLLAVTVSRVLLVCLVLLALKAHQEKMVTRSESHTYLSFSATSHSIFFSVLTTILLLVSPPTVVSISVLTLMSIISG